VSTQTTGTVQASVLVVDDEVRQLGALCDTLEDAGYKTTGFTSARDALAALRETEFDLLLTDLTMPEMDGVALLRAAQEIDPHLVGVVATGHGTIDTAVRAMQAGALDYIVKPFTLSTALPVIARAIKVKRLRSENIQLREALVLSEVSTTVASVLDPLAVLNKVADAVFTSVGPNGTALFTANHDRQKLEAAIVRGEAWSHLRDAAYPIDESVAAWITRMQDLFSQAIDAQLIPQHPWPQLGTAVAVPMLAGGRLNGMIAFEPVGPHRRVTRGELRVLSILASAAAAALDHALLIRDIRQLNQTLEERVRTRTAELEMANKDLEAFSFSVSHDLRAPLRAIGGFAQLLREQHGTRLGEQAMGYLARIETASHRMGDIIEGLLRLSQASRLKPRYEALDLAELAREIAADLQAAQPHRSVQLLVQAPLPCCGDRQFLQTALENLLGNAWKFTARRADARIEVGMTMQDDRSVFFVRDNGAGFDPSGAAKLFEAFQRLHSAQHFPGTGIGLATVQRIIRNHGGDIWAEGQSGKGAAFYFTLPGSPQ
jgi:signal transduction histidine kinase